MKIEITNLKDLRKCDHCFCLRTDVKTGYKIEKGNTEGVGWGTPIYTNHKKCCNCEIKIAIREIEENLK